MCNRCTDSDNVALYPVLERLCSERAQLERTDILDRNGFLDNEQILSASEATRRAMAELTLLKQHIDEVSAHQRMLQAQFHRYQAAMNHHRYTTSSLRHLPTEILSEIMRYAMPCDVYSPFPDVLATSNGYTELEEAPWSFTRVSRRWRSVALATPDLWTHVCINLYNASDLNLSVDLLGIYLACSDSHPLDVTLYIEHVVGVEWYKSQVLQDLLASSERWRSLDLQVDCAASALWVLPRLDGKLPSLQFLSFDTLGTVPGDTEDVRDYSGLRWTPSLIYLQLHFSTVPHDFSVVFELLLPWARHLTLHNDVVVLSH
jgi:hypothetical protein